MVGMAGALARAGDAERARRVAEKAVNTAERIEGPEERVRALAEVASTLARASDAERARRVAEEAVSTAERISGIWKLMLVPTLAEAACALAQAGQAGEALDVVEQIKRPRGRAKALAGVAGALARAGAIGEAREIVTMINVPSFRSVAQSGVIKALVRKGSSDAAVAAVGGKGGLGNEALVCLKLKKKGIKAIPEIMVPLTGILYEFLEQEKVIRRAAKQLFNEMDDSIDYKVGTMIEIPRAALTANRIASAAEFFSFGTNDLTQMTFGYSRDDIASFLPIYLEKKILKADPFQVLDRNGVGQLGPLDGG